MDSAAQVLAVNDDLPVRTGAPVHSGKVRAVYWLTEADSRRLAERRGGLGQLAARVVPLGGA